MTRTQLESLAGKLQAVSNCVCPTRIFVTQLFNKIPMMRRQSNVPSGQHNKDEYQMVENLLTPIQWDIHDVAGTNGKHQTTFTTDAYLTGVGGFCKKQYFHQQIPAFICNLDGVHIAHLKMYAMMVGLKYGLQDNQA